MKSLFSPSTEGCVFCNFSVPSESPVSPHKTIINPFKLGFLPLLFSLPAPLWAGEEKQLLCIYYYNYKLLYSLSICRGWQCELFRMFLSTHFPFMLKSRISLDVEPLLITAEGEHKVKLCYVLVQNTCKQVFSWDKSNYSPVEPLLLLEWVILCNCEFFFFAPCECCHVCCGVGFKLLCIYG